MHGSKLLENTLHEFCDDVTFVVARQRECQDISFAHELSQKSYLQRINSLHWRIM